jgi:hypothetical protein
LCFSGLVFVVVLNRATQVVELHTDKTGVWVSHPDGSREWGFLRSMTPTGTATTTPATPILPSGSPIECTQSLLRGRSAHIHIAHLGLVVR